VNVKVRRILIGNDHDDTKWIVLEGFIDGIPQVTKRRTINTAALVSGHLTLEGEKAQLIADVEEYYTRFMAVQVALKDL
jgi:hypothetical protein